MIERREGATGVRLWLIQSYNSVYFYFRLVFETCLLCQIDLDKMQTSCLWTTVGWNIGIPILSHQIGREMRLSKSESRIYRVFDIRLHHTIKPISTKQTLKERDRKSSYLPQRASDRC